MCPDAEGRIVVSVGDEAGALHVVTLSLDTDTDPSSSTTSTLEVLATRNLHAATITGTQANYVGRLVVFSL